MEIKLLAVQPDPAVNQARLIERAARLSYGSAMSETDTANRKFLGSLWSRKHFNVFEHGRWCMKSTIPDTWLWHVRGNVNKTAKYLSFDGRARVEMFDFDALFQPTVVSHTDLYATDRLQHAALTFFVGGVSLVTMAQFDAHRARVKTARSGRRNVTLSALCPQSWIDAGLIAEWTRLEELSRTTQETAIERGVPLEDVRYGALCGVKTDFIITMSYWSLQNFFNQRLADDAQWEIRAAADWMHTLARDVDMEVF